LALILFLLLGVSGVNASVSHDHHEEIFDSPFNAESKNQSLHCPLEKRHLNGQVCPHRNARDNKKEVRIAADCGGSPNAAVPATLNFSKNNVLIAVDFIIPDFKNTENIFVSSNFFQPLFSDRIDHPPRS